MQIEKAQLGENGRVVIPSAFRKALGLKGGEVLTIRMDEDGLHIQTKRQALLKARAILREHISPDRRLSDELIAERRIEARREAEGG